MAIATVAHDMRVPHAPHVLITKSRLHPFPAGFAIVYF
jgi:hypothetical protein